jgi:hypothetical protein
MWLRLLLTALTLLLNLVFRLFREPACTSGAFRKLRLEWLNTYVASRLWRPIVLSLSTARLVLPSTLFLVMEKRTAPLRSLLLLSVIRV